MTTLVDGPFNYNEQQSGVCFDFPNEVKIDFLLTFRCNAACAHCITESNPHRRESLTRDEVLGVLEAGVELGKRYVSFTGGEPFLDYRLLLELVSAAHRLGYYVASDTNAFWGRSEERAKRTVADLLEAGLDALFPSADSYHLPWIPLSSVVNVVAECDRQGLTCEVNFIPGPDAELDAKILDTLDLRDRGYFCDGLSLTGNDVQGLVRLFPHRLAEELTDVGSMHRGISRRPCWRGNWSARPWPWRARPRRARSTAGCGRGRSWGPTTAASSGRAASIRPPSSGWRCSSRRCARASRPGSRTGVGSAAGKNLRRVVKKR
jgi:hypothetical protein